MTTHTFGLDGKLAVVTGGASGIGRAIAATFAAHGATVHILDRDGESAEAAALEIVEATSRETVETGGSAVAFMSRQTFTPQTCSSGSGNSTPTSA